MSVLEGFVPAEWKALLSFLWITHSSLGGFRQVPGRFQTSPWEVSDKSLGGFRQEASKKELIIQVLFCHFFG
jgi:hypothetical protein